MLKYLYINTKIYPENAINAVRIPLVLGYQWITVLKTCDGKHAGRNDGTILI